MKEQPVEPQADTVEHAVGQRPIHATYEPPGPIPQFRRRPKLRPAQPAPKREVKPSPTAKPKPNMSRPAAADTETAGAKKSS